MAREAHSFVMKKCDLLVLACVGFHGCGLVGTETVCTLELRHGIVIELRHAEAATTPDLAAYGIATDGAYRDSLVSFRTSVPAGDPLELVGVPERAGVYDVVVREPGRTDWHAQDVEVREDECHVIPVRLQAVNSPI